MHTHTLLVRKAYIRDREACAIVNDGEVRMHLLVTTVVVGFLNNLLKNKQRVLYVKMLLILQMRKRKLYRQKKIYINVKYSFLSLNYKICPTINQNVVTRDIKTFLRYSNFKVP